jgi:hypothetical protein
MMCPATDIPATCEIRTPIRLLAKNVIATETHNELRAAVCDSNVLIIGTVRQWSRILKDGRKMFAMKSEVVGRPSLVSDDLVQSVEQQICKEDHSQFQVSQFRR